ncbi:MAG: LON peptidase substrate-binding domain-containing protein, partial [Acidobacteria bacterium]|nr:LON peptidase substrate-binding domain-containing protein [Acidobacteriota bacterium]
MSADRNHDLKLTEWLETEVPTRLPVLPLVSTVLFPGGVLSLQVGIEANVQMIRALPDDQQMIAAFAQKGGDREHPRPEDLSEIGVIAMVVQRLPLAEDRYQVFLQGRQRVRRRDLQKEGVFYVADVEPIVPPELSSDQSSQLMQKSISLFERLVETDRRYNDELLEVLQMNMSEGANLFGDLLSTF